MSKTVVGGLFLAFTLATGYCSGQGLVLCDSGVADSLSCSQITLKHFWGRGGRTLASDAVLYQGKIVISRLCSLGDGEILVGFGNEHSNGEAFTLKCAELSPTSLFNSYRNGMRQGLWFHRNIFRTITKVEQYDEGKLQSELRFWANGLPRQRIFYKDGKPKRWQKRYNKKGYPLNGTVPF